VTMAVTNRPLQCREPDNTVRRTRIQPDRNHPGGRGAVSSLAGSPRNCAHDDVDAGWARSELAPRPWLLPPT